MRLTKRGRRRWLLLAVAAMTSIVIAAAVVGGCVSDDSAPAPAVTPAATPVVATPEPTPTATPEPTPTATPEPTPTATPEPTPTATPEPTPTATPEPTPTATPEPTPTATPEPTPTATPEPTPTATPEPTPTATPEPTPTATPEPTPTATPEPTPTATPEPTPTATPEPTPTATPEPTPDPSDLSWAPEGSLTSVIDPALIPLLGELVLAGRVSWEAPFWLWPDVSPDTVPRRYVPLLVAGYRVFDFATDRYTWHLETRTPAQIEWDEHEAAAQEAGWEPAFPGAARTLARCSTFGNQGCESVDPAWVAHIGLELPPTILPGGRHPFLGHDDIFARFSDEERGFYPPLKPGVNVTYAAGVDMDDLALRPECPVLTRVEALETLWHWPRGYANFLDGLGWDGYLRRIEADETRFAGHTPVPQHAGRGAIWLEDEGTWQWRMTLPTPYGWYTFDIDTREMRPVDTSIGSWDYTNLWLPEGSIGDSGLTGARWSLGMAGRSYAWLYLLSEMREYIDGEPNTDRWREFVAANPWPPFEPWREILLPGQQASRPSAAGWGHYDSWTALHTTNGLTSGYSGYLRLTCGAE